jgi:hypothetical protein
MLSYALGYFILNKYMLFQVIFQVIQGHSTIYYYKLCYSLK